LLDRYNLGLAQGLLLYTDQVTLELERPELLEVRRVLGWLKFCRLVAWLERSDQRWTITVEGPGAILSMQKKYGLQLATFLGAVPLLSRYRLSAPIDLPRKKTCTLELTRDDPLVSPFARTPGHLPEEVQRFVESFEDERWTIDPTPEVVQVGVRDVAVPDFTLEHREKGARLSVELFHRWHRAVLLRRIEALATKPDPNLVLGVDRSLLDDELERKIEASDRMFVFNAFPSKRALEKVLAKIG
jgi:predicted nuclease of restriction endonuclease-like RecB superfamily